MKSNYNTLVLSGGAMRAICHLGAIQYFNDNKLLDNIDTIVSSSAGSIIAYLYIIGYSPIEMLNIVCSHPIFTNGNISIDLVSMFNRHGGLSFSPIRDILESLTIDKIGQLITLGKLKSTFNIDLVISTFNYDERCVEYISASTHPDIPCMSAIQMSCALPFIFPMYKYMGCRYLDAGIIENTPLNYLETKTNRQVVAIIIEPYIYPDNEDEPDLYPFIHNLMFIPSKALLHFQLEKHENIDVVDINLDTHFLKFNLNTKEKFSLFTFGYHRAEMNRADSSVIETVAEPSLVDDISSEQQIPTQ